MKLVLKGVKACTITIAIPIADAVQQSRIITLSVKKKIENGGVPYSLQKRINSCRTLPELLQLLFATTKKTEAVLKAFDAKIDELEKEQHSLHNPLNRNNNGSTTPAPHA